MFESITKIEISASSVAWYGAIVATLSCTVALLNYWRDRARVKVKVSQGLFVYSGRLGDERQVIIEAVNHGRRIVTVTSVGFLLNDGNKLVITTHNNLQFPAEIHEGKAIQAFIPSLEVKAAIGRSRATITHAWYQDATGKIYKTKWKLSEKM